jgi:glycosyltransferase involved in cell wall biosynthesis
MKILKLSIIIPAFNEGNTIHLILNKIKAVNLVEGIQKEIIIVNDYSTDHTEAAIAEYKAQNPGLQINYFKHEFNKGKGAALHTGISKATGEYLIIQDADLEYDPEEYNDLLKPVCSGLPMWCTARGLWAITRTASCSSGIPSATGGSPSPPTCSAT